MSQYCREVLMVAGSDSSASDSSNVNISVWNPINGTIQMTYKGGRTGPRTTTMLGSSFLVSGQANDKPILNVWQLNRQEQRPMKEVLPAGPVRALSSSSDGTLLIAGIAEDVYVWQLCTGRLIRILQRHFQNVTCIAFNEDDSHFATAAEDGSVIVWNVGSVVSSSEPRWSWHHHYLSVTDIYIGLGGLWGRIYTSSLDQSVKVCCLASGNLLLDVCFPAPVTAISIVHTEISIYCASGDGNISEVKLTSPPRNLHMKAEDVTQFAECGSPVRCLSISLDDITLASGSDDGTVRLWHVGTRQCIRILTTLKGKVSLLNFVPSPRGMLDRSQYRADVIFSPLQRVSDNNHKMIECFAQSCHAENERHQYVGEDDHTMKADVDTTNILELKQMNANLYNFAVKKILASGAE